MKGRLIDANGLDAKPPIKWDSVKRVYEDVNFKIVTPPFRDAEQGKSLCPICGAYPAAAQPEQDERAAFELWVNSISENPNFNSAAAMWAWSAWQARAAQKGQS